MKKRFNFGKIAVERPNIATNTVTVDMEYKEKSNGQKVLSVSGMVWNSRRSDCIMGGQCLDEIAHYVKTPVFREIYRLWKLYHLNDMHPECEHQAAAGWTKEAGETVNIYHFSFTPEASKAQKAAQRRILTAAGAGEIVQATPEEMRVLSLSYFMESETEELPEEIAGFYKLDKVEEKRRGWLSFEKDSRGILGKPCPVCGYKYGHGWQYRPIPAADEEIIYKLLKGGPDDE